MVTTENSRAEQYVRQKAWEYQVVGDQLKLRLCPLNPSHSEWKFFMHHGGQKDGLWDCKVCGEAGNLHKLQTQQGDRLDGVMSMQDRANEGRAPAPLPDVEAAHRRLLEDEEGLEYVIAERGFTMDVVKRQKLGLENFDGKKWLVIPYFQKERLVFVKHRSLPPAGKEFRGSAGREAPLYNEDVLIKGMEEIIFVEGEADCISCLSNGLVAVVGVPGANIKKASWITRLDEANPKKTYILYDRDKVGQKAAREMALRIGIEKVYNILLPEFKTIDDKEGKDINEWFRVGHTLEEFEVLKAQARPFDVDGVTGINDALDEMEDELLGKVDKPTIDSPWPSLNGKLGGCEYGDVIGIIAEGKVGKTTMAMDWLDYLVDQHKITSLLYCLEMPPRRMVRKWVSYVTKTDDTPGNSKITVDTVKKAKEIAANREADFLFGFTQGNSSDEVFDTIRQAVRRYGVKVVVFDNLQLLVRSIEHSAQETSVLTKKFKKLAMELGILILLIIQPNRVREGEIVAARNAHGSSAIEKDVDAMIALHRNRKAKVKESEFAALGFLDTEENFEPQMLVRVDLSRYSPGGCTTLMMEGGMSLVREFTPEEMGGMPKATIGVGIPQEAAPIEA